MSRTLVMRLSALGDVAMLIPVLYSVAVRHPDEEFLLATKSPLLSLLDFCPANVRVIPVYTKGRHKGIFGLWRLVGELSKLRIDRVADMHNVLRSRLIVSLFSLKGKKTAIIDKGKTEKRELTKKRSKKFISLKTSIERYREVFSKLGYDVDIDFETLFDFGKRDFSLLEPFTGQKNDDWVGIAPFAKHAGKIYPPEKTEEVIRILVARPRTKIFLFGGKDEIEQLKQWETRYPSVVSVAGLFSFTTELLLMSYLDVMFAMDSGNMHLASLVNIPVVSVWGATHPYAGFYGYRQHLENAVQHDLFCRPCSVFGERPCYRHNYECLHTILPDTIVEKIIRNIENGAQCTMHDVR